MRLPNWKFRSTDTTDREEEARRLHEAAWPDMFANLQSAYAELTNAQFELERRTAEIAETRDLFQQVISSMSEALFLTDRSGRVIRANPAAAALLECQETSILGRPLTSVCGSDEIPATPWKLMELAPTGRVTNLETEIHTLGGMAIPVSFSLGLMHDKQNKITGVLAVARDMRETRSLINSLVAARTRFQELLEFAPDAIVLANQDGEIVLVNSQTERLFGYKREELLGRSVEVLVPERLRERRRGTAPLRVEEVLDLDEALTVGHLSPMSEPIEVQLLNREGREFQAEITRRQIETEDGVLVLSLVRDITDRKHIAAALRESEERYRTIAETASDVIITVDEDGIIEFINPAVENIFGYAPEEVAGQQLTMLIPEALQYLSKAGNGHYAETGEQHGNWANVEVPGWHRDGYEVPVEISFSAFAKDGRRTFTGVVRDVSVRKQIEEARHAAERRFHELFDNANDIIYTHDLQGNFTSVNPMTEQLTGYPREEVLQLNIGEIVAPEYLPEAQRRIGEHFSGRDELPPFELEIFRKDGQRMALEVNTRLIVENGQAVGVQGIAREITERKRLEEERDALLAREQEARQYAESMSRLKDDFLAMISHELRAPLTAILGWAQMLRSGTLDRASAERALLTIERNAKSQAHLVGDLLDASRIATGKLNLESRPVELMSVVEAAVDAVRPSVEAKSLRLQMVLEPWVGPFKGDPERLKQIVWNLLSNAIKFTPPGGLIEVRLERLENKALLIVSDTGQGIEPDFLPYIFDRFRQADSSTKRKQGGLGLGLAIVKHLVELHNGAIYAYSRGEGQGSDFMITLPLAIEQSDSDDRELWPEHIDPEQQVRSSSLRGAKVLVVDDEHDTREILSVMLARYGTEVRAAGSVAEALEVLSEWQPDVLVSDIGMPVEDGYVMINKLRALPAEAGGEIPAIALTAFASPQDKERSLAAGFQRHLAKPVEPVELAKVVARLLGRSEEGIVL